jgi:PTS system nitrogen regulatory IIA component
LLVVHRLDARSGGVHGPAGDAPSRPSGLVTGATVSRIGAERPSVDFRPDVIQIVHPRQESRWSAVSIPRSQPSYTASSGDGPAKAGPRLLSELVGEQDVLLGMQADRKRSALRGLTVRLAESVGRSHGAVLAAFLRRERLGPTAVGHGIAIPHAHLEGISAPAAVLATLKRPVAFGTPDDTSVDLLLALLWPTSDMKGFVPTLLGVWRHLQSTGLPDLLRQSRTPPEALAWMQTFEERVAGFEVDEVPDIGTYSHLSRLPADPRCLSRQANGGEGS